MNQNIDPVYAGCGASGESTILDGNVTIAIPSTKTLTNPVMEGFNFNDKYITVSEPVKGVIIKRCQSRAYISSSAASVNLTVENCFFGRIYCANMVAPIIRNSYTDWLQDAPTDATIVNTIAQALTSCNNCTFVNIGYCFLNNSSFNTYVNCLYRDGDANSTYTNCVQNDEPAILTKA